MRLSKRGLVKEGQRFHGVAQESQGSRRSGAECEELRQSALSHANFLGEFTLRARLEGSCFSICSEVMKFRAWDWRTAAQMPTSVKRSRNNMALEARNIDKQQDQQADCT